MIVKIPQQHISEQLLRESDFNVNYSNTTKKTTSRISGFSFLAFKLKLTDERLHINLRDANALLDWNNSSLYELLIPSEEDYKKF